MTTNLILTGDVNLMNVSDAMVPFALVRDEFHAADIVFCNLECCLYRPPDGHAVEHEGFFADPRVAGEALRSAGVQAIGLANNVNYGEAAIMASIARLDELGIAHTGAGLPVRSPALRRSFRGTGCALALCSAARFIGRPITRPVRILRASQSSAVTRPITCRCTAAGHQPTVQAFLRRS